MQQVYIGRRSVTLDELRNAVSASKSYTQVCNHLGFNSTVGTTINNIKMIMKELESELNTEHFRKDYTLTNKRQTVKQLNISKVNRIYFDEYMKTIDEKSKITYKSAVGNFMEHIGNRDFATVLPNDIVEYAGERKSVLSYIRSAMIFIVQNDINGAEEKANRKTLIWLITKSRD